MTAIEPKPEKLVHAFAHALPGRWFEMAAMLNGATCLDWAARLIGETDIAALLARVEARFKGPSPVLFLPYLSGERTPHNDADARGVFAGLDVATTAEDMAQAVLDGVALSLVDARDALGETGRRPACDCRHRRRRAQPVLAADHRQRPRLDGAEA